MNLASLMAILEFSFYEKKKRDLRVIGALSNSCSRNISNAMAAANVGGLKAYKSQSMKNYHLHVEYRHLHQHAPPGLFVLPSFTDIRTWFGVVFLRSGVYRDAIFKFRVDIPFNYPEDGALPSVTFASDVFHPLIDAATGKLELSGRFPTWTAGKDYIIHVLLFVKKIFYVKDFAQFAPMNAEAHALAAAHSAETAAAKEGAAVAAADGGSSTAAAAAAASVSEWRKRTRACVEKSIDAKYESEQGSSIVFTPPTPKHEQLRSAVTQHAEQGGASSFRQSPQFRAIFGRRTRRGS